MSLLKTFLLTVPQRLKIKSQELDVQNILCDKAWNVFNDEGVKQLFIFQPDGILFISTNGVVSKSSWQFITANNTIIISSEGDSRMFHPAFLDDVVFVLQQDGDGSSLFMIDEKNKDHFMPKSLDELNLYFSRKVLIIRENNEAKTLPYEDKTVKTQVKRRFLKLVNNEYGNGHDEVFEEDIENLFLCKHTSESGRVEYWYEFRGQRYSDIYENASRYCYNFIIPVDNYFLIITNKGSDNLSMRKWDVYYKDSPDALEYDKKRFEYRFPNGPLWSNVKPYEWRGEDYPYSGEFYLISERGRQCDLLVIFNDKVVYYELNITQYSSNHAQGEIYSKRISERCFPKMAGNTHLIDNSGNIPIFSNILHAEQFRYNHSLKSIVVPNSVNEIEAFAFEDCINLSSVSLPNSLTMIDSGVFKNCVKLSSITIPNNVKTIEIEAFYGCKSLNSIVIPDSVTEIWHFAFENCSSLKSLTIPDSVIFIGKHVFKGCDNLKTIIIKNRILLEEAGLVPGVEIITSS